MKKTLKLLLVLVVVCGSAISAVSQPSRGITPEDYFAFEFISDPNISPDGKVVAYVVTKVDRTQNRRNSSIWMVATDGSRAPWQFTTTPQSASSPRWSPDGQWLAFLSARPEGTGTTDTPRSQVYVLSMNGGEARKVTNLKN